MRKRFDPAQQPGHVQRARTVGRLDQQLAGTAALRQRSPPEQPARQLVTGVGRRPAGPRSVRSLRGSRRTDPAPRASGPEARGTGDRWLSSAERLAELVATALGFARSGCCIHIYLAAAYWFLVLPGIEPGSFEPAWHLLPRRFGAPACQVGTPARHAGRRLRFAGPGENRAAPASHCQLARGSPLMSANRVGPALPGCGSDQPRSFGPGAPPDAGRESPASRILGLTANTTRQIAFPDVVSHSAQE